MRLGHLISPTQFPHLSRGTKIGPDPPLGEGEGEAGGKGGACGPRGHGSRLCLGLLRTRPVYWPLPSRGSSVRAGLCMRRAHSTSGSRNTFPVFLPPTFLICTEVIVEVLKSTEWKSGLRCINVAAEARRQVTAARWNLNLLICKMGIITTCLIGWSQGMRCEFSRVR